MANKLAERNTQAYFKSFEYPKVRFIDPMTGNPVFVEVKHSPTDMVTMTIQEWWQYEDSMDYHNIEGAAQHERNKPKPPPRHAKPDKMHLYVNNKHKLTVDADRAHEVAATYMEQGDSVWLSRKVVTL